LQRLLLGTLPVTNFGLLSAANHEPSKGQVHQGLNKEEDLLWLGRCPRREEGICRACANGSGRPGALRRPKQFGQLGYARVTREGLRVAVVGEDYPKSHISG
jgi:hypothetical protein